MFSFHVDECCKNTLWTFFISNTLYVEYTSLSSPYTKIHEVFLPCVLLCSTSCWKSLKISFYNTIYLAKNSKYSISKQLIPSYFLIIVGHGHIFSVKNVYEQCLTCPKYKEAEALNLINNSSYLYYSKTESVIISRFQSNCIQIPLTSGILSCSIFY